MLASKENDPELGGVGEPGGERRPPHSSPPMVLKNHGCSVHGASGVTRVLKSRLERVWLHPQISHTVKYDECPIGSHSISDSILKPAGRHDAVP